MSEQDRVFAKCAWRLIPFIAVLYLVNFIDRLNVGFAALTMNRDLGFSSSVFGLGAGIFFIGYLLFHVPANLILHRLGTRRWMFCILAVWGLISAACAFATDPVSFYLLRFLLGVAESGFFPGMIFYLTLWFPAEYRARLTANFSLAVPLSAIIGGPLSGIVLGMDGLADLHGWQWLFLLEGLPAVVLAFAVLKLLPDSPQSASWLSAEEKRHIALRLAYGGNVEQGHFMQAFCDWRYWAIGLAGFVGFAPGVVGTTLFLPQIVQAMGFTTRATGYVVAVPYVVAAAGMIFVSRSSDAKGERIWHFALPMLAAAAGFLIAGTTHDNAVELAALTAALVGVLSAGYGPFYPLLASLSTGKTSATGIALANALNIIGGFFGPTIIGVLRDATGNYTAAMALLAAGCTFSAFIFLSIGRVMAMQPRPQVSPT
jgi:ACS family tartrate transporter-like MFS transporter